MGSHVLIAFVQMDVCDMELFCRDGNREPSAHFGYTHPWCGLSIEFRERVG